MSVNQKWPLATAICEQLTAIALGTYDGPGTPESALAVIEHIIKRSDFTEDEAVQVQGQLKLAREVFPTEQPPPEEAEDKVSNPKPLTKRWLKEWGVGKKVKPWRPA